MPDEKTWVSSVAGDYGITGKVWDCPTTSRKGTEAGPDYVYSTFVANQALGDIHAPEAELVTADGRHEATTTPKVTSNDVAYTSSDFDARHNKMAVGSYADGHVAVISSYPWRYSTVLWLRADAGVTQSGGVVSAWTDQSGNEFNATAAGAAQPAYQAFGLNRQPALYFDGTDDIMNVADVSGKWDNNMGTVCMVFSADNDTAYTVFRQTNSSTSEWQRYTDNNGYISFFRTTRVETYPLSPVMPSSGARKLTIVADKTTYTAYSDGVAQATKTMDATWIKPTTFTIGGGNGASGFLKGWVAELILCDTALSADARDAMEAYLKSKYGI
ncbi:MAG: LamG-like jellyroll fold domain-containing protein [Armatimonadota bacterium]